MTIADRCAAFARAFPGIPAAHFWMVKEQGRDVAYARWLLGNNYRSRMKFYGEYPPHFLERIMALFPDVTEGSDILHVFSGSLPPGNYHRLDVNAALKPDYVGSVYDCASLAGRDWTLILADPPYSIEDAKKYGTPMIDRRKTLAALAEAIAPHGHLCYLDTCWPMHRKDQWTTVARVAITRSTNHRTRDLTIFQRSAA